MSLINQVLNDLESRRAEGADGARLPREVRPLPNARSSRATVVWAILGTAVVGLIAWWAWYVIGPERPLPQIAGQPPQVLANTTLPPLAVSAPPVSPMPAASPGGDLPMASSPILAEPVATPQAARERGERAPELRLSPDLDLASARPARPIVEPAKAAPRTDPAAVRAPPAPRQAVAEPPSEVLAIEKSPVDSTPRERAERLYRSALSMIGQGHGDDGITTLRAALREDPTHVPARQLLLKIYVEGKSWDAAQGVLRDGLAVVPGQYGWAMLLSRLLADRGDNTGALQVLETHEAAGRSSADYQAAMGAVLQRLSRTAEAEQRFQRATELDPGNARWWLGLATSREALGKAAAAREAYGQAVARRTLSPELQSFAEEKLK